MNINDVRPFCAMDIKSVRFLLQTKIEVAKEQSEEDDNDESEKDECESGGDEEVDEPEEESETETPKSVSKKKESKRSHHKLLKCHMPRCSEKVGDIKRHFLTHVKKKEIEEHSVPKALAIIKAGKKRSQHFTWQIKGYSSRKTKEMVSSTRLFHIHNHTPHGSTSPKGNKLACSGVKYRVHLKSATHYIPLADDLRT